MAARKHCRHLPPRRSLEIECLEGRALPSGFYSLLPVGPAPLAPAVLTRTTESLRVLATAAPTADLLSVELTASTGSAPAGNPMPSLQVALNAAVLDTTVVRADVAVATGIAEPLPPLNVAAEVEVGSLSPLLTTSTEERGLLPVGPVTSSADGTADASDSLVGITVALGPDVITPTAPIESGGTRAISGAPSVLAMAVNLGPSQDSPNVIDGFLGPVLTEVVTPVLSAVVGGSTESPVLPVEIPPVLPPTGIPAVPSPATGASSPEINEPELSAAGAKQHEAAAASQIVVTMAQNADLVRASQLVGEGVAAAFGAHGAIASRAEAAAAGPEHEGAGANSDEFFVAAVSEQGPDGMMDDPGVAAIPAVVTTTPGDAASVDDFCARWSRAGREAIAALPARGALMADLFPLDAVRERAVENVTNGLAGLAEEGAEHGAWLLALAAVAGAYEAARRRTALAVDLGDCSQALLPPGF